MPDRNDQYTRNSRDWSSLARRILDHMARRGIVIVFSLLGVAAMMSMLAFATLYFLVGRAPALPSNAVLSMDLGGELTEVAPNDVVSYFSGNRTPTLGATIGNLRKAKADIRRRKSTSESI